jgi:serine phosphatase RsbU (regulator of sigma subunit)/anti-sigma regulatory factor (Ser/Thr protein kinase)/ABC-type transporter Mla MlaB component
VTDSPAGDIRAVVDAFDQAPVMLSLCEGDPLVVTAYNARARSMFGPMLGASLQEAFGSEGMPHLAERLEQVAATGETFAATEWRVDAPDEDGREVGRYLDLFAQPLIGADGSIRGVATVAVDVTETVRARRLHAARTPEQRDRWFAAKEMLATMQDAILPEGLPVPPGASLAARYLMAETDAGGDWFDVVALDDGRIVLVVGDVVGHGVAASVAMGELRAIFDERVRTDGDIVSALQLLDQRARRSTAARAATVCAVVLDPTTGAVTYCTAGHPPPLQIRPGVGASYLPVSGGPPLGAGKPFPLAEHQLAKDDVLMLYSDGLVDRPHRTPAHNTVELSRLASAVYEREAEAAAQAKPVVERVCAGLLDVATRAGYFDDITLLAAQRVQPAPPLEISLPAGPDATAEVRRELAAWLTGLGVSRIDETVLQHSVGELVGNVVEHAYTGSPEETPSSAATVEVVARHREGGVVDVTVTDHGHWREPDPTSERGRGLALVQGFCEEFEIAHGPMGTRACLRHHPHRDAELLVGTGAEPRVPHGTTLELIHSDGHLVLRGPVERRGADRLRHQLAKLTQGGTVPLSVDLSEVTLLTSAGVQVLFEHFDHSPGLRLVAPMGSPAQHVLDLVQLPYARARGPKA